MVRTSVVAAIAVGMLAVADAAIKCGDLISLKSVENGRFWRTHRSETTAISTGIEDEKNMYIVSCKWKADSDPITFGDSLYLKSADTGEYLEDGGQADHSAAMHNHIQTSLTTVNASVVLSPLNEFTIFPVGDAKGLNDRAIVQNNDKISFRNRYTRFWIVPENSNKIVSQQYGAGPLDDKAAFIVDGFCPLIAGKACNRNGACEDNRCVCDRTHTGAACTVEKKAAFCHAIGSGNFKSFDGVFFEAHSPGEFLLYASPEAKDKEAVTITMGKVVGAAEDVVVPIKVSFRKGGDIVSIANEGLITINCGADMNLAVKSAQGAGFLTDSGLRIYSVNQLTEFEIRSPSGAKVVVHSNPTGINVWVHIFEPRTGELKGMCGDFDGTASKELSSEESAVLDKTVVQTYSVPETSSFANCGAEASVSFIEVAPAFAGLTGGLTQLIVSKSRIMGNDRTTEMDRAKLNLHAATHTACAGSRAKMLSSAKSACATLSISTTAIGLSDYSSCLADYCLTGEASALSIIDAAKQDLAERNDKYGETSDE